jgi:hypothetical protein
MKKTDKVARRCPEAPKATQVTDSLRKGEDMLISWPDLGNKGVVVGDIKLPAAIMEDDYVNSMFGAEKVVTGGIFVNVGEQQIWPIRYSADTVNVTRFEPGKMNISEKIRR